MHIRHPFLRAVIVHLPGSAGTLAAFLVLLACSTQAGTSTWNGAGADANWNTVDNWDMLPAANDDLVFNGAATARPANTNDYPADTPFNSITFNSGDGAFNLNGNRIQLNGNILQAVETTAKSISLDMVLAGMDHTIDCTGTGLLNISGIISGSGGLAKTGAGTLNLTGAHTYTGTTVVSSGQLLVNGSLAAGSAVTVKDTASLGGSGTCAGQVTVEAGAAIVPGDPAVSNGVGTLAVGSLALQADSILSFQLDTVAGDDDVIDASAGGITISGGKVNLHDAATGLDFKEDGTYRLIRYSGTAPSVAGLTVQTDMGGRSYEFRAISGWVELTINSQAIISIDNPGVVEGNSGEIDLVFNVSLPFAATGVVSATWQAFDGTAKAGLNDYVSAGGTVSFLEGDASRTIVVKVKGDAQKEPDETLTVVLSNASGGMILDDTGTGTLVNDDAFVAWHVDPAATNGAGNGYNWEDAYTNLTTALAAARAGEQIWVAKGTYYPDAQGSPFTIQAGVAMYGGFGNGNRSNPGARRDPTAPTNQTVLSGDINHATTPGLDAGNAANVVYLAGDGATLDGFIIQGAYFLGGNGYNSGGAVKIHYNNATVRGCIIRNNYGDFGGGIGGLPSSLKTGLLIENCIFTGNIAPVYGSAAGYFFNVSGRMRNCTVAGNGSSDKDGSWQQQKNANLEMENCIFWDTSPSPTWPGGFKRNELNHNSITVNAYNSDIRGGWLEGTGNLMQGSGVNMLNVDPQFVDAGASDFRLNATSQCLAAGDPARAPATDIRGVARSKTNPAIGAYEGLNAPPPLPVTGLYFIIK